MPKLSSICGLDKVNSSLYENSTNKNVCLEIFGPHLILNTFQTYAL